ncbi:hypothetical protein NPJ88_000410 [Halomonas elongata]|uniref:hypothetical protein n=1 Tax=Halomonas elongata TaxID=2746 RepID=UPI00255A7671|nr:hypothetical protein [Halomonas elongata]MDL4860785.1 hypothetical protein [Halomonas elongata]
MTMQETTSHQTQLDRIEGGVMELNQRVARMEERVNSQGSKIEAHETYLSDHARRIREVELANAVAYATGAQQHTQLSGRWAAMGAVAIALLSVIGSFAARIFFP